MTDQRSAAPDAPPATDLFDTPAPWSAGATAIAIGGYIGFGYLLAALVYCGYLPAVDPGAWVVGVSVISAVLALAWLWWLVQTQPEGTWSGLFGLRVRRRDLGLGAAAAAALLAVETVIGFVLAARFGSAAGEGAWKQIADDIGRPAFAIAALVGVTIVPIVEELVFRGMLLRSLVRRLRVADRIALASVVFGLVHVSPYVVWQANLTAFIQTGVVGAGLCIVARLTGRLGPGIVAHALINVAAFGLLLAQM